MMHKHINTNLYKMQVQWKNHSYTGDIYNKNPKKKYSGSALCKIHILITYNIYIVTATTGTTSLVYAVYPLYYKPLNLYESQ